MSARSLTVHADLTLSLGPDAVRIRSEGDRIDVDLPPSLWRCRPNREVRRQWAGRAHRALAFAGLSARIRMLGFTLARLGVDARAPILGRLLGLKPGSPA